MNQDSDEIAEQTAAPGGVRGKYYAEYMKGTNVVLLDPDMAKVFRDSKAVNAALREYVAEHSTPPAKGAG